MSHISHRLDTSADDTEDDQSWVQDPEESWHEGPRSSGSSWWLQAFLRCMTVAAVMALVAAAAALQQTMLTHPVALQGRSMALPLYSAIVARSLTAGGDARWSCSNGSISVPAVVPGVVHMALQDAGLLGDPLYRYNELDYAWVTRENWTWTAAFDVDEGSAVDAALLGAGRLVVELDSVDTVAEVRLNGRLLGAPRSAFVRWRLSVKRGTLRA
eukprot:1328472-Prymnesium_polylepis.1